MRTKLTKYPSGPGIRGNPTTPPPRRRLGFRLFGRKHPRWRGCNGEAVSVPDAGAPHLRCCDVSFFFFATRSSYYSVARDLGRLAPPARGALQGGERGQGAAMPQPCGPPEAFLRDFGVALHPRLPLGC